MACDRLKQLNDWEIEKLVKHINDNAWFLGQKHHRYVSFQEAEIDFILHYLGKVGAEMRLEFCTHLCPLSGGCDLIPRFVDRDLTLSGVA